MTNSISVLKGFCLLALLTLAATNSALADTTLVKFGSSWKYLDNGTAAPTGGGAADWRNVAFSDGSWGTGPAEFGYGDNDERTVVSYGGNASNKYITTYFRKIVNIADISLFANVRFNMYLDDGAVIYVNGAEVVRTNMPAGGIISTTLASAAAAEEGNVMATFDVAASNFVSGNNIIAVEVHQNSASSSDLSFDLEMIGKGGGDQVIFDYGSSWKYWSNSLANAPGATWVTTGYAETGWSTGNGVLYYNDAGTTNVGYGPDQNNRYPTIYFRKTFTVNPASFNSFTINLRRDDGAIVYINGTEVARTNITSGAVTYSTLATASMEGSSGGTSEYVSIALATSAFTNGSNTIAVEVHNYNAGRNPGTETDLLFDMQLTGGTGSVVEPDILRGPMMQMVSGNAITIKWKTSTASTSRIMYGTAENSLTSTISDNSSVTDHEMRITGLTADTKYFYAVGTGTSMIRGSYRNYFITAPPANTTRKIRIGVFGDAGTGSANQKSVRNGYLELKKGTVNSELALMLGDNAYNGGLDNEHQTNFFDIYDDNVFNNHTVFSVPGNHEYNNSGTLAANHAIPYYTIFTVPTAAESGGTPSGTEHYYSFDYGNIHFIMLDSYGYDGGKLLYDSTGAQALWLKADLAAYATANQHRWLIVSLHHPPYTHGTHNSDSEPDLVAIRQQITPILERYGVDVVLAGHSHVYERSFLVQGHTGLSGTFNAAAVPVGNMSSNSSAKYDGSANSCPYFTIDSSSKHGTVYVVAGSAGQVGGGTNSQFPVFYYQNFSGSTGGETGALYIEVQDNRLDAKFVGSSGTIRDRFTIMKGVNQKKTVNVIVNNSTTLTSSWVGSYNWYTTPGSVIGTSQSLSLTPNIVGNYTYYVNDSIAPQTKCMADTFLLQVITGLPVNVTGFDALLNNNKVFVKWTTQQEVNTDYFTIERSANGRDFEMNMMVRANGNSSTPINYEYQDSHPMEGNNFYRLISTDKDGKSTIVGTKLVVYRPNRSVTLSIKPNPATGSEIKAVLQSNKRQLASIRVFDLKGAEVYSSSIQLNTGNNSLKFTILPGAYFMNVEAQDGYRLIEKIIVK